MLKKIAFHALIVIMIILLGTSVMVIAKGPVKKVNHGPNVKSLAGHFTLIKNNPSNWLSSWMGQK